MSPVSSDRGDSPVDRVDRSPVGERRPLGGDSVTLARASATATPASVHGATERPPRSKPGSSTPSSGVSGSTGPLSPHVASAASRLQRDVEESRAKAAAAQARMQSHIASIRAAASVRAPCVWEGVWCCGSIAVAVLV